MSNRMEITTKIGCKNNCVYCPQETFIKRYAERSNIFQMSFDTFKTCIDKIPSDVIIEFSGMSEPWLNPECTKMLFYAHKKGHKIKVFTTLIGMSSVDVELLSTIPLEYFCVHLPSEGNLESIMADESYLVNLCKLCKSSISVDFLFKGEKLNPKVATLLNECGKVAFQSNLSTRANNVEIKNAPLVKRKTGILTCLRKLRCNVLLPNGEVILCCPDWGMKHVLGNLK